MGLIVLDNAFLATIIPLISLAKEKILISSFKIELSDKPRGRNLKMLFNELFAAKERGVKVSVLFNWHADQKCVPKTNLKAGHELKNKKIEVRYLPKNRCCHSKIFLIDQKYALIGSHNLSIKSTSENFELSYLITNDDEIKSITKIFEQIFADGVKL